MQRQVLSIKVQLIIAALLFCFQTYGQVQTGLFVQSRGGEDYFKLLWTPDSWSSNTQGVNVKRKADDGEWELLNQSPIIPASDDASRVNNVTNSPSYRQRLKQKYDSLVTNQKIRVLTPEDMYETFLSDTANITFLKFMASIQYDLALIHGYAYYDTNVPEAETYTYGLFLVDKDGNEASDPIETVEWTYGSEPDYTLQNNYEIRKIRRKKGIQVVWQIETAPLLTNNIKGFHIYRIDSLGNRIRETSSPLRVNVSQEIAPLAHVDRELDATVDWTFQAVPIDIFDSPGPLLEAEFSAAAFPEITDFNLSIGESNPDDPTVRLEWSLNEGVTDYIRSLTVLRRQNINDPKDPLTQLSGENRSYADESIEKSGYYFYQVQLVTTRGEQYFTNEQMVYKQLIVRPEIPTGLRGSVMTERGTDFVFLRWDPLPASDTLVAGYHLYTDGVIGDGLAREGTIGLIEKPNYKYEIKPKYGKRYRFAVSAESVEGIKSGISDTIAVFVPSKSLPQVNIWPIDKQVNIVTLNWNYVDFIDDLEGFRLYQNGNLIADEQDLPSDTRQWISEELEPGRYVYEIEAVSRFDVTSKVSQPRTFNIQEQ